MICSFKTIFFANSHIYKRSDILDEEAIRLSILCDFCSSKFEYQIEELKDKWGRQQR